MAFAKLSAMMGAIGVHRGTAFELEGLLKEARERFASPAPLCQARRRRALEPKSDRVETRRPW
jgi:hypothetical protein